MAVVERRAEEQVRRSDAWWVIALMADVKPLGDGSVCHAPRDTMSELRFTELVADLTISARARAAAFPHPAALALLLIDLLPESLDKGGIVSHRRYLWYRYRPRPRRLASRGAISCSDSTISTYATRFLSGVGEVCPGSRVSRMNRSTRHSSAWRRAAVSRPDTTSMGKSCSQAMSSTVWPR
jgi:hypothetical protein